MFINNDPSTYPVRRLIASRLKVPLRDIRSVDIEMGAKAPKLSGERRSYHHETKGGSVIYHPSAYAKSGWSNIVYVSAEFYSASCGIEWVAKRCKTRQLKRSLNAIKGHIYGTTDEAKAKRLRREIARRSYRSPNLTERLARYKEANRQMECEFQYEQRRAELWHAGFDLDKSRYGRSFRTKEMQSGWYFHSEQLPPLMDVLMAYETHLDRTRLQREAEERRYEQECALPQGKVHFTSEGGFYVDSQN